MAACNMRNNAKSTTQSFTVDKKGYTTIYVLLDALE